MDMLKCMIVDADKGVVEAYASSPSQNRPCDDAGFWHGRSWNQFEISLAVCAPMNQQ